MIGVSKQIECKSHSSELSQNVDKFGEHVSGSYFYKSNILSDWVAKVIVYMFLFSDSANDYSDNISQQVDMDEVKAESNESDEFFSVCKNINMVDKYSSNDGTTSEGIKHILFLINYVFNKIIFKVY